MGIESVVAEMVVDIRTEVYPNVLVFVCIVAVACKHLFLVKSEELKVNNLSYYQAPSLKGRKADYLIQSFHIHILADMFRKKVVLPIFEVLKPL